MGDQEPESGSEEHLDLLEERDIRYLNYVFVLVVVLGLIGVVSTYFFVKTWFLTTLALFIGLTLGVLTAYYYYSVFSAEDRELILSPDEHVILETSNKNSFISIPTSQGGYIGDNPPLKVNLYLTNKAVIAEPLDVQEFDDEGNLYYFQIRHADIIGISHESNFLSDYIRLTFRKQDMTEQDVLLLAGDDTSKWIDELTSIVHPQSI